MDKTVTVLVERQVMHPVIGKVVSRTKKYHAHNEGNDGKVGDKVVIEECRRIADQDVEGREGGGAGPAGIVAYPLAGSEKPAKIAVFAAPGQARGQESSLRACRANPGAARPPAEASNTQTPGLRSG